MQELRTQENEKFERFFQLVRDAAAKQGCVFFVDCGEGNEFSNADMEGENLSGWLIPESDVNRFRPGFLQNDVSEQWDDRMRFLRWTKNSGQIDVAFENF